MDSLDLDGNARLHKPPRSSVQSNSGDRGSIAGLLEDVQEAEQCFQRVREAERALARVRRALSQMAESTPTVRTEASERTSVQKDPTIATNEETAAGDESSPQRAATYDELAIAVANASTTALAGELSHKGSAATLLKEDEVLHKFSDDMARRFGIAPDEVFNAHQHFCAADQNATGRIDTSELRTLLDKINKENPLNDTDYAHIIKSTVAVGAVSLDFEEFLIAYCNAPTRRAAYLDAILMNVDNPGDHAVSSQARVQVVGVPEAAVKEYIEKELQEEEGCRQIPVMLALFIAFLASITWHNNMQVLHGVTQAINFDIVENANFAFSGIAPFENGRMGHKGVYDVNGIADFWSFFDLGLVPVMWPSGWGTSETRSNTAMRCTSPGDALTASGWPSSFVQGIPTTPNGNDLSNGLGPVCPEGHGKYLFDGKEFDDTPNPPTELDGKYLLFSSIIGGVRLQQERVDIADCVEGGSDMVRAIHAGVCTEVDGSPGGHWLQPDGSHGMKANMDLVNRPGGRTVFFKAGETQTAIRTELRRLENSVWFDHRTLKVEVMFPTYNPQTNILVATYVVFYLSRAGHLFKNVESWGFRMDEYQYKVCYVFDLIWAALVLKIFIEEGLEVIKSVRGDGLRGFKEYLKLQNVVDWFCVVYSFVLAGMWITKLMDTSSLREFLENSNVQVKGNFATDMQRDDFFNHLTDMKEGYQTFRVFLAMYPFVVGMRFFSVFSQQARLAVVTDTLMAAANPLFHYLIVFGTCFIIFTVSGHIMFGEDVEGFGSWDRALTSVFRVLLGDFDWDALSQQGRHEAGIWFWMLQWFLNLVMLNMLLAIIMDVYGEVKSRIPDDAETVVSQTTEIFYRWLGKMQKKRISLATIWRRWEESREAGGEEDSNNLITVRMFRDRVTGITNDQAESLLIATWTYMLKKQDKVRSTEVALWQLTTQTEMVKELVKDVHAKATQHGALLEKVPMMRVPSEYMEI